MNFIDLVKSISRNFMGDIPGAVSFLTQCDVAKIISTGVLSHVAHVPSPSEAGRYLLYIQVHNGETEESASLQMNYTIQCVLSKCN